jgi:hypothetical protein
MAISNAVTLANFSSGDALTVDNINDRVGIASTTPTEALTVVGVVSATSFSGSGANLTDVISGVETKEGGTSKGTSQTSLNFVGATVAASGAESTITVTSIPTQIAVTDESSDTTCFPVFVTDATGNVAPKSGTNLTFNSSTGALSATSFVGALTGNVTGNISGGTGTFSGDVDIADKIVHTGDTNTAIRFPAADTFTVETAGSERVRVDSSGNVAINYTSPLSSKLTLSIGNVSNRGKWSDCEIALDNPTNVGAYSQIGMGYVFNTTYASAYMGFVSTSQATFGYGDIVFGTRAVSTDTQPTERLRITSAGLVRIPDNGKFTAGAGDDLQIHHDGSASYIANVSSGGHLNITTSGGGNDINVTSADDFIVKVNGSEDAIKCTANTSVELYHNNVKKFETQSSGVAIHEDTDKVVRFTGGISEIGSVAGFQATNTAGSALTSFGIRATDIRFATGSAERLRITSGGVVGINTTTGFDTSVGLAVRNGASSSDHTMIDIIANTNETSRLVFSDDTDHNQGRIQYNHTGNSLAFYTNGNNERLSIDSDGNFIFKNGALIENGFHDNGGGLTGNYIHDLATYGNVHFSSTNAAGTFTYNLRINSSATLNSVMSEGDVLSYTLMHASNNTSYYLTQLKIDGTNVTPVWAGGSAPSAATGSGFDVYSFSIMKTGNNAYGIFGTFTNHA